MAFSILSEALIADVRDAGYDSEAVFAEAFQDAADLELWGKSVLIGKEDVYKVTEDTWRFSSHMAKLRRCLKIAKESLVKPEVDKAKADADAQAAHSLATAQAMAAGGSCNTQQSSPLSLAMPQWPQAVQTNKLDADARRKLWHDFGNTYTGEFILESDRPAKQLVQSYWHQKVTGELILVPWKRLLSQAEENVSVKGSGGNKESRFLAIMAEAHGMVDDIEIDSPTSHFRVTKALSLRATCWALVGWCHLKSAKTFASHVMEHFTKRPLEGSGLRSPTAPEAEAADQALVETLVSLMGHSNMTLDQAIYEVVDVRCMAATLLVPRPLAAKATNNNTSHTHNNMPTANGGPVRTAPQPKATPYGQSGQSKKMPCHLFKKTGACKFGDQCKFKHTSGSGHGRAKP
ncbi:unnamed protein product [Polarella glacialis]|uniref:C3H1-type domain-containing protein n=1 Tax=Polarella glacialis TaxID=89957 RepID=A0A813F736_POLGL|nr:unnamed protein product [Polarella glacialis]